MKIEVVRTIRTTEALTGKLALNGVFECFTLENTHKAIEPGVYMVTLYHSPRLGYQVLLLHDVPGRTAIEIHIANRASELEGCIAVGQTASPNWVGRSGLAFEDLMKKVSQTIYAGEPCTLTLEEAYTDAV